jgi:hypothetical protein
MAKVFNLLPFFWLLLSPLFWRFDLSKGTIDFYDAFLMAPNGLFHVIVFYALMLFSLFLSKVTLYHLLLLSLYFPAIQLANYPFLTIRDVYMHAAPAQTILTNGTISSLKDAAAASWPSSFNLHAVLSEVLGCDLIITNYILYLVLIFVFAIILCSFAKKLNERGYRLAGLGAVLFLGLFFTHLLDNFHHYSRTALAFTFLLLFIYVFTVFNGRQGRVLHLLVALAVITTHPFQSAALLGFAIFYFILTFKREPSDFAPFLVVVFVGWFAFNGSSFFEEAVNRAKTFLSPQYIVPLVQTLESSEVLPWWGVILRNFFKYSLIALLLIGSISTIWVIHNRYRCKQIDRMRTSLSALLPMATLMLVVLLLLPDWLIWRFTPFAAFPAAFTSFLLLDHLLADKRTNLKLIQSKLFSRRVFVTLFLVFIIILSAAVMVLRFENNYYYGELDHPSELSSLSFFFNHDHNSTVNIISWRTAIHAAYFNYDGSHETLRLWYLELNAIDKNSSLLLLSEGRLVNQSDAAIRGIRDEFDFHRVDSPKTLLTVIDESIIQPRFDQIYSNGYYTIYKRQFRP